MNPSHTPHIPQLAEPGPAFPDNMPNPTAQDLQSPLFNAVYNTIKGWDVNVPTHYVGYCGATGSHAMLIVKAVRDLYRDKQVMSALRVEDQEFITSSDAFNIRPRVPALVPQATGHGGIPDLG